MFTKTKRKELVRDLLDTIHVGRWFNDEEVFIFNELTGFEYKKYKIVLSPFSHEKKPRNVYVQDVQEMRSWRKQIDDFDYTKKQRINQMQAMRNAIIPSLQKQNLGMECNLCGSKEYLTVDHKTIPFIDIAEGFLSFYPNFETGTPVNKLGHYFIDGKLEQEFITIHDELADYQLLCRSCNSKKGAK